MRFAHVSARSVDELSWRCAATGATRTPHRPLQRELREFRISLTATIDLIALRNMVGNGFSAFRRSRLFAPTDLRCRLAWRLPLFVCGFVQFGIRE